MNRIVALAFAGLSALVLVACQKEDVPGESPAATAEATANPAEAIVAAAEKLKSGDLLAVVQIAVPPSHYERMKANWTQEMNEEPITEEDRNEFAGTMAKLTAPDAEQALFAEAEPELAKFETEMAAQMPMMIGMGQGFAMQAIQNHETMSESQKKQAGDVVTAVAGWLQGVRFADRDLARQAIAKTVATARALELKTLDEARALEFEAAMGKAGIAFRGVKDVLAVYGFDLDQSFSSVKAEVVSEEGDQAKVKVDYQILGQPLSFETAMVRIDGRWYGKDTVEQLEKELNAPKADAAAGEPETASADAAPERG